MAQTINHEFSGTLESPNGRHLSDDADGNLYFGDRRVLYEDELPDVGDGLPQLVSESLNTQGDTDVAMRIAFSGDTTLSVTATANLGIVFTPSYVQTSNITTYTAIFDKSVLNGGARVAVFFEMGDTIIWSKNYSALDFGISPSIGSTDAVPTENSTNPVQSGGVYDAIQNLFVSPQDTLTLDNFSYTNYYGYDNLVTFGWPVDETEGGTLLVENDEEHGGRVRYFISFDESGVTSMENWEYAPKTPFEDLSDTVETKADKIVINPPTGTEITAGTDLSNQTLKFTTADDITWKPDSFTWLTFTDGSTIAWDQSNYSWNYHNVAGSGSTVIVEGGNYWTADGITFGDNKIVSSVNVPQESLFIDGASVIGDPKILNLIDVYEEMGKITQGIVTKADLTVIVNQLTQSLTKNAGELSQGERDTVIEMFQSLIADLKTPTIDDINNAIALALSQLDPALTEDQVQTIINESLAGIGNVGEAPDYAKQQRLDGTPYAYSGEDTGGYGTYYGGNYTVQKDGYVSVSIDYKFTQKSTGGSVTAELRINNKPVFPVTVIGTASRVRLDTPAYRVFPGDIVTTSIDPTASTEGLTNVTNSGYLYFYPIRKSASTVSQLDLSIYATKPELSDHVENDKGYWQVLQQVQNQLGALQALMMKLQLDNNDLKARVAVLEDEPAPEPDPVYDMSSGQTLHTPPLLGALGLSILGIDKIGTGWTAPSDGLLVVDNASVIGLLNPEEWIAINGNKAQPSGSPAVLEVLNGTDSAQIAIVAGDVVTQSGMGNITFYTRIS